MDPLTLSLLVSAGTSAIKGGVGAAQALKGTQLGKRAVRPTFNIASSKKDYLNNAIMQAQLNQLPGQQLTEEKLSASTGAGIRAAEQGASSSAGLMATIAGLKGIEQEKITDLGIRGAEFGELKRDKLQEALWKYGGEEDQAFAYNKDEPYKNTAAAAQAMKGAGMQNIMTGIEGLGGAASIGLQNKTGGAGKVAAPTTNNSTLVQQYVAARKSGFKGTYNDWLKGQSDYFETDIFSTPVKAYKG